MALGLIGVRASALGCFGFKRFRALGSPGSPWHKGKHMQEQESTCEDYL